MSETKNIYWTDCKIKLSDLKPWSDNPRMSTKAQAKRILASFEKFGQVQPVAIGPGDEVYDGHQRLSALFTIHGGDYAIDARRASRSLSDNERRELVLALHNATGGWNWDTLSGWNADVLKERGFDGETLKQWNSDANNLKEFLKAESTEPTDSEPQIDRAEELRVKWGVELGQMWQLGEHRIICGDCTVREVVERVMGGEKAQLVNTDPPYGVDYDGGANNEKKREKLEGDKDATLYAGFLAVAPLDKKCAMYLWHAAGVRAIDVYKAATGAGFEIRSQIIWHKLKAHYGAYMAQYKQKHEPCIYCVRGAPEYCGPTNEVTVWEYDQPSRNEYHPTEKPVELFTRAIKNHPYEIIYEPFSGSGTTIIACQNLGRKCRAIEISPAYVAVAIERFSQAFPGVEIKRLD